MFFDGHISEATEDVTIATRGNWAIAVWLQTTRSSHVAEVRAAVRRARETAGPDVVLLQLVAPQASMPDSSVRKALVEMLRSFEGIVTRSALVHVGSGFRASMIRSIVTGLNALSQQRFPHRVFSSLPEAVAWLGETSPLGSGGFRAISKLCDASIVGDLAASHRQRSRVG